METPRPKYKIGDIIVTRAKLKGYVETVQLKIVNAILNKKIYDDSVTGQYYENGGWVYEVKYFDETRFVPEDWVIYQLT